MTKTDRIPEHWLELAELAKKVRGNAYAPYSRFLVGCALEDERGRFHTGCNVENVNYSETLCAERVAVVKMISEGGRAVKRIALITSAPDVCFPCGGCLQVINEFGSPVVFSLNVDATQCQELPFDALLPHRYTEKQMRAGQGK